MDGIGQVDTKASTGDDSVMHTVIKALEKGSMISRLDIEGESYKALGIKGPGRLVSSSFRYTVFDSCTFRDLSMTAVFFEHCRFSHCEFRNLDLRFALFSGSYFQHCVFQDSTVVAANLLGVEITDSDFSFNDFYSSDFSLALITSTPFEDCNLKRASFRGAVLSDVSFRYSNIHDALNLETDAV